jgi:hypothetical protein
MTSEELNSSIVVEGFKNFNDRPRWNVMRCGFVNPWTERVNLNRSSYKEKVGRRPIRETLRRPWSNVTQSIGS